MKIKYKPQTPHCKKCGKAIIGTKYIRGINFVYHDWCYRKKWGYHHE